MSVEDDLRRIACAKSAAILKENAKQRAQAEARLIMNGRANHNYDTNSLMHPSLREQILAKVKASGLVKREPTLQERVASINVGDAVTRLRSEKGLDEPTPDETEELPTIEQALSGLDVEADGAPLEETVEPEDHAAPSFTALDLARAELARKPQQSRQEPVRKRR